MKGVPLIHSCIVLARMTASAGLPGVVLDAVDTEPKQTEPLPSQNLHSTEVQ